MKINLVKMILVVFSVCCVVCLFTSKIRAAQTYTEKDYYYELKDDSIIITGYFGSDTEITLPDAIAGYPVSKIASGAFVDTTVKVINLPDTIMDIEENAIGQGISVNYEGSKPEAAKPDEGEANDGKPGEGKPDESKTDESKEDAGKPNADKPDENVLNSSGSINPDSSSGSVEEAEVSIEDANFEDSNYESDTDTNELSITVDTSKGKHKIKVDRAGNLIIEDSEGNKQVIDDNNEYTASTEEDKSVIIKNKQGDIVTVGDDGTIKVGDETVARLDSDGEVSILSSENNISPVTRIITIIIIVMAVVFVIVIIVKNKKVDKKS